jgi:hypothetical protein
MFMGPKNQFQGTNSARLCSLAGRYENPIPPRCLAPIDFLKIPALATYTGFIRGILRGVRCTKSLRVLFLHRRSPSWTTLVLYSRAVFIFNEPTFRLAEFIPRNRFRGPIHVEKYQLWVRKSILSWFLAPIAANYKLQTEFFGFILFHI